jgi:hypothetical protein
MPQGLGCGGLPLCGSGRRRRPGFQPSEKCRGNVEPFSAGPRLAGSAAPQHLSKRLIWLTISCSSPAAARRRLARRPAWKLQRNSRETDEMSGADALPLGASAHRMIAAATNPLPRQRVRRFVGPRPLPAKPAKAAASIRARQPPRACARSTARAASSSRRARYADAAASGLVLLPIGDPGARARGRAQRLASAPRAGLKNLSSSSSPSLSKLSPRRARLSLCHSRPR